jgi:hypothetical protein
MLSDSGLVERGSTHSTYYDVLGVTPSAEPVAISAAYRALIKKYHPDRNAGNAEAIRRTRLLNEAYEVLCDPEARNRYDALTVRGRTSPLGREQFGPASDRPGRLPAWFPRTAKLAAATALLAISGLLGSIWLAPRTTDAGRQDSLAAAPSPPPREKGSEKAPAKPALTSAFLAGRWARQGTDCTHANTITFSPDGSWADQTASGTWHIRKNRVSFVTNKMLDASGRWATLASPMVRVVKVRVQSPDRMVSALKDEPKHVLERCASPDAQTLAAGTAKSG